MPKSPTPIKDLRQMIQARKVIVPDKQPAEAPKKLTDWLEVAKGIVG